MATKTRINVPKDAGDEIVVRWDGNDATTYRVTDGHVSVEPEYADRFVALVDGSKVDAGTTSASKSGGNE